MSAVSLLYHDALDEQGADSGFPGPGADVYKLDIEEMRRHFAAIAATRPDRPINVHDLGDASPDSDRPWLLTFDDGGVSAALGIADLLESHGWVGHFFITAGMIGSPGFVDAAQIRELVERGHVVGSHSWSHPTRMSHCSWTQLCEEWRTSITLLREITGQETDTASVPGGYYSEQVAQAAALSGVRALFTSEPVRRTHQVGHCLVLGRYTLQRGMPASRAAALCTSGLSLRQIGQFSYWNLKKAAKAAGGRFYPAGRQFLLRLRG